MKFDVFIKFLLVVYHWLFDWIHQRIFALSKGPKYAFIGNNAQTATAYRACKHRKILLAVGENRAAEAFGKDVLFLSFFSEQLLLDYLGKCGAKGRDCRVVVHTQIEEENLRFAQQLRALMEKGANLRAYVFLNKNRQKVGWETPSGAGIIPVDKYGLIAKDFFEKRCGVGEIKRWIFVGFGETNRRLYEELILQKDRGRDELNSVSYHIFDEHTQRECPIYTQREDTCWHCVNINDGAYYQQLFTAVRAGGCGLVIAFANDMENLDMARRCKEKLREWDLDATLFVKTRKGKLETQVGCFLGENVVAFGGEERTVFDVSVLEKM